MWKCGNMKYENIRNVDSGLVKCWKRSENKSTFHIHTFATCHHNPTALFCFSKVWAERGSPEGYHIYIYDIYIYMYPYIYVDICMCTYIHASIYKYMYSPDLSCDTWKASLAAAPTLNAKS